MLYLLSLALCALIIWVVFKNKKNSSQALIAQQLQQRNQSWINFIAAYENIAKTQAEKQFVQRILNDIALQGLGNLKTLAPSSLSAVDRQTTSISQSIAPRDRSVQLDNTSLLLYFGAFLFVASVGLFIAFGGASGTVRAFAVLLVMVVMYCGGLWLYRKREKLQLAALTFVGIGTVIAPLVGLAFYSYVANRHSGQEIWLGTSFLCMALYSHALVVLRKTFISYILLFTFLSLFESGISVTNAPIYYFGWGLALVGILLQTANHFGGYWRELQEASKQSARALLPLSVLAAIGLVPNHGVGQLGVSLLIAAAFYYLEIQNTKSQLQEVSSVACQISVAAGVGCVAYALGHNVSVAIISLLIVDLLQLLVIFLNKLHGKRAQDFASVLLIVTTLDTLLAISRPGYFFIAMAGLTVVSLIIWWKQQRSDAYSIGVLAFMSLPYIVGQQLLARQLSIQGQTLLALVAVAFVLSAYISQKKQSFKVKGWLISAQTTYILSGAVVAFISYFGGAAFGLGITVLLAATMLLLAEKDHDSNWSVVCGFFLAFTVIRSCYDSRMFLISNLVALVIFIAISLRYRRELLRWGSTALWLLLPLALSRNPLGIVWTPAEFALAYIVAMAGLIYSRAVARGVIFVSQRVPMASFAQSASLSYVIGYCFAALVAVSVSLRSTSSHFYTTVILVVLMMTTLLLSLKIEKRLAILAIMPILAQAFLISLIRPNAYGTSLDVFLLSSSGLSVVNFMLSYRLHKVQPIKKETNRSVQASLLLAFVTPATFFFAHNSVWPMPLGLFIAGILLSYYVSKAKQSQREWAGAVITLSLIWLLSLTEIHKLQAYIYLIVATLGIYAYWRHIRGEHAQSDNYVWALLLLVTVPLAIQAISGQAGGLYGWWLLLQQIAIMLLGMYIRKRFVTLWGLYVAVGAVLYQLRNLGWAALTVLALFLIGLAVYQLQKHSDPPNTKA